MSNSGIAALDDQVTRRSMDRYRRRSLAMAVLCFGALALSAGIVAATPLTYPAADSYDLDRVVGYVHGALVALGLIGLLSLARSIRIQAVLSTSPWAKRRYRVYVDPMGNHRPSLVLLPDADHAEAVLLVSALRWRVGELQENSGGDILVAGNPFKRVVLQLPGSDVLLVARRPWMDWSRNRMRTLTLDQEDTPPPR